MIKRLSILCVLICLTASLAAQKYGNEWINYNQKHYRISIPKTGLYKIDYNTLINTGIPLSTINPKNFQVFIKGKEQYINIAGEADNVFDTNDYIEFFARKNDASFDSLAYTGITRVPNPYIALYNDTNYAYLTWNSQTNNKRIIVETDVNFSSYSPINYFYSEKIEAYTSHYSFGPVYLDAVSDPRYVVGEGFGSEITNGNFIQTNFGNLNIYSSPTLPVYVKSSFSGTSIAGALLPIGFDHQLKIEYLNNSSSNITIADTTFYGINNLVVEKQINSSQLQNNSFIRVTSINNPNFFPYNNSTNVHYVYLKYPQLTDFLNSSEQTFYVDNSSGLKTFLDIQNVNVGSSQVLLYDITNHKFINTVVNGNNVKALVPNSINQKECFLTTSANITNVTILKPVNQTGFFANYKTTNLDSAFVIINHKSLQSSATQYKQYRQSVAGGANHVIMADIDDLYDQFAYGNVKNPLAIKNFAKFLSDSLPVPPKYLLLIGKSIKNSRAVKKYNIFESGPWTANYWNNNLIPTMGTPSSDNLLTTGIHGANSTTPFIPIGRISAKNNLDVTNYLNKVVEHELSIKENPLLDWHKRVLHFSGGADLAQQQSFQAYLDAFGNIIKDTLYGATTFSFAKTSTAPIQITVSDSIRKLIEYGCSLITFFGHGSVTGFDQAIDDPSAYQNQGKYPLFLANSCYSGDIHLPDANSTSENFTLKDKQGSIGFIASSSAGVVNTLYYFSHDFYTSLAYETYYGGIGDAVKNTSAKTSNINNQLQEITSLEMTLEGDPSIRLNAFSKPDYEITNSSVYFNTTTHLDSIGINVVIKNNAKAINDTFIVRIEHFFPNGDSLTYFKSIKAPKNKDTLSFFVYKDFNKHVGLNHFHIFIDDYAEISELSETNNSTIGDVDLFISGGDVTPVYPYKYAIIPNTPQITLKATTANPFALSANYKIQLDTNDTFTNPINSTVVTSAGGVIKWTVNLPFGDSTVYFWRIKKDSVLPTDINSWKESSFQVIGTKTGWSQAHFHQFKNDKYRFVKFKRSARKFAFENDKSSLTCRTGFFSAIPWTSIHYTINNYEMHLLSCAPNGWEIAVFDSTSAEPRASIPPNPPNNAITPYGNCHCKGTRPLYAFDFGDYGFCGPISSWQTDLQRFIDSLPVNTRVLAYSSQYHHSESFPNTLVNAFESFGGPDVRAIGDSIPIIIFGKKGMQPGQAHYVVGANHNSVVTLNDSIETNWTNGYIASEIIGPATKWNSLHWRQQSLEFPSKDSITLKLIGIRPNGMKDTLAVFSKDSTDIYDLSHYISSATHPKMQLVAFIRDDVYKTSAQLKKWQVMYDEVPECAINPQIGFSNNSTLKALQEGDNLIVHIPIENIGAMPFNDSLVITYWIEDANRVIHTLPQKLKAKPFLPNQVIIDTVKFNTYDTLKINHYSGFNYLWIDVNTESNSKYQLEQYHFNNIARIGFNVNKDNINPLLDVTFDGSHILNGDIVSSKPHVLITLKDENKFLALNDTSKFKVFIKYPNQAIEKRILFSNALQFTPAQLPNNSCKIEWKPEFAEDGKYKLLVQASDRSSNVSGAIDYNILFEIVNKQTVTEVLNYPNPFSTSTRFVFTLTGSEIPDIFTIQIMTITGKVVKEITKNELGNLHIGRNITEYAWDGKDEFGDKLANGVYLYKVITRHNGSAVEKQQTDADSFFKKGIGKLVIIR